MMSAELDALISVLGALRIEVHATLSIIPEIISGSGRR